MGGTTTGYISLHKILQIPANPPTQNLIKYPFYMISADYTQGPVGQRTGSTYDEVTNGTS